MSEYPAGEITHNGVTVPIFVDDWGHWSATYAGTKHTEESRPKLDTRLKRTIKRTVTKVNVPFVAVRQDNQQFKRGTAYGIHEGTGNILAEWDDGTKEQIKSGGYGAWHTHLFGNIPDADLATWVLLARAARDAQRTLAVFVSDHERNLKDDVMRAADEAADKARGDDV
jgi:hypothetical protein